MNTYNVCLDLVSAPGVRVPIFQAHGIAAHSPEEAAETIAEQHDEEAAQDASLKQIAAYDYPTMATVCQANTGKTEPEVKLWISAQVQTIYKSRQVREDG